MDADFDEFVAGKADIDFVQHGGCEAGVADDYHGLKVMRARFERDALRRCQIVHAYSVRHLIAG